MNATVANSTHTAFANATDQAAQAAQQAGSVLARPENLVSWSSYFQALAILCLIIACLWAVLWYLKRRGGLKVLGLGDLVVENRLPLGPKKNLMVVRFLNKRLLLGVTDQQITLLTELPAHDDTAPPKPGDAPKPASFTDILKAAASGAPDGKA